MGSFLAREFKKILPTLFVFDAVGFPPRHSRRIIFMFTAIRSVYVWFVSFMLNYVWQSNVC